MTRYGDSSETAEERAELDGEGERTGDGWRFDRFEVTWGGGWVLGVCGGGGWAWNQLRF